MSAQRTATGTYFLDSGLVNNSNPNQFFVTALGTDTAYCKVRGWNQVGNVIRLFSGCIGQNGLPADSMYVGISSRTDSGRCPRPPRLRPSPNDPEV